MNNIIIIISFLLIGVVLNKTKWFPEKLPHILNSFVIYFSYPALVLLKIPKLDISLDLLATAVIQWIVLILSVTLIVVAGKFFKWKREVLGSLLLIVPLGNTSFLGFPMIQAFYGEQAVSYALVYDQLGSFLALTVYGSFVLVMFSEQKSAFSIKRVIKKIMTFPPFIAFTVALILQSIELPKIYFDLLKPIAATLIPLVMIAIGFQLKLKINFSQINPFIIGLSIKMLIAPVTVIFIVLALDLETTLAKVTVFEAAMPPMITAGILAIKANLAPRLTASMIAYGVLLSFTTLPVFYWILDILYQGLD